MENHHDHTSTTPISKKSLGTLALGTKCHYSSSHWSGKDASRPRPISSQPGCSRKRTPPYLSLCRANARASKPILSRIRCTYTTFGCLRTDTLGGTLSKDRTPNCCCADG